MAERRALVLLDDRQVGEMPSGDTLVGAGGTPAYTSALTGTAYDLDDYASGVILRMENTSAATITVPADAAQYETYAEYGIHALGTQTVTIVEDTGVTVTPPAGGSLVMNPGDFALIKRRGTDLWALVAPTDAPSDGRTYGRRNGLWAPFERPSIITMTAALSAVNAHLMNTVVKTATGNLAYTIPPVSIGTFEPTPGDVIAMFNNNTGNMTITRGSGVTLYYLGTNQNVTLAARRGLAVVYMPGAANVWGVLA